MLLKRIKTGMVVGCLCYCSFFLILPTAEASSEFQTESEIWSKTANRVAEQVEKEDLQEARTQLAQLAHLFSKSNLADKNLSVEGIHALSDVIMDTERNLNRISPDEIKLRVAVTRLQITFDAVSHPHQPLWKQYYNPMNNQLKLIREAIKQEDSASVQDAIDQFYDDYQMIRPALIVSKSPYIVEKVDSIITFIRKQRDPGQLQAGVSRLERMLQPLFFGSEQEVLAVYSPLDGLSLYAFAGWVSALIVMVLGYVSWRKYRATQISGKNGPVSN
ncbi:sporulation protein YpjB [Lihuaxuella thermophila]|uniref:Sporulation protein YpjB n=1 Tax=Lihuaxuella thermophila TaxID=1173111 RepID=A0A1H8FAN2_9BACL|nr:sporulation protein YpjB [Lihuaxuella thermophila]SEN28514.1 sporulation protein YpjB [Lihuaxuella thermophila]